MRHRIKGWSAAARLRLGHFALVSLATGAALAGYALVNAPSAAIDAPATPPGALASVDASARHADETATASEPPSVEYDWVTATVKPRDTLSRIFKRHGLRIRDAFAVADLEAAAALRVIRPGRQIQLAADEHGALAALRYGLDEYSTLRVTAHRGGDGGGGFHAEVITRTPDIKVRAATAVIRHSLLRAAQRAGLEFETVYALAQLFDWQVDFAREIQPGDQFALLFEERYLDGRKVGNGDIIAAELETGGRQLRAIRHIDEHGRRAYYAPNGDGIQRSFLRSPVDFARVTSNFAHKRFHPILKKWRAHRGVDYGVPHGTPVRATGDGVVTLAARRTGYGKTVMVRHGLNYTTLYAHLHAYAKGVKRGARVAQGQVIGYVGNTGWSTGAHLHYEFRVGGVHRNPLTVDLPKSAPIAERYRADFLAAAEAWVGKLEQIEIGPLAQFEPAQ